jgi:hypothetical protein
MMVRFPQNNFRLFFDGTCPDAHRTFNRFSTSRKHRYFFGAGTVGFFNGMGCAKPMNGSMRNRLSGTTAFFARNSRLA